MLKIELERDELQIIVNALGDRPFREVAHFLPRLMQQANDQIDAAKAKLAEKPEGADDA